MSTPIEALLNHPTVTQVADFLRRSGVPAWLVGGVVRDAFLGRPLHDLDFAVAGDGLALARRLAGELRGAFVALDTERDVGRVVVTLAGQPLFVDLAALRGDGGIEADLLLRDFTVNAMAVETTTGTLVDPAGGHSDLRSRLIRAVSDGSFRDDPLRMLRAVRLAGQLGFEIEPTTLALIRRDAGLIVRPSAERVRDEILALLASPGAAERVRRLEALGLLPHLLPELLLGRGVTQPPPHESDVYEHNLAALAAVEGLLAPLGAGNRDGGGNHQAPQRDAIAEAAPAPSSSGRARPDLWADGAVLAPWRERMAAHLSVEVNHGQPRWLLLKIATLLHDVGKPATRSLDDQGRIHFYRHEIVGAEMSEAILRRLKMPSRSIARVGRMIAGHLRPLHLSQNLPPTRRAIYRYFRAMGDAGPDVALLSIADQRGKGFRDDRAEVVAVARQLVAAYFDEHDALVATRPLLTGKEIASLAGIEPGPRVGELLEQLKEAQASGRIGNRDEAIRYLRDLTQP